MAIDSQSVKTTEAGKSRGYDAGKKIMGRKRHALIDANGRTPELLIPTCIDHDPLAHLRRPIVMMRHG